MKFIISKRDKAGNRQFLRHIESAQALPETLTACEKNGVCPLPGWVRVPYSAHKFNSAKEALDCIDTLPKLTTYTVGEYNGFVPNQ